MANGVITHTVTSGVSAGASVGTAILPGWGTAIGAAVGGIAGWLGSSGIFSGKKKPPVTDTVQIANADGSVTTVNSLSGVKTTAPAGDGSESVAILAFSLVFFVLLIGSGGHHEHRG